MMMSRWVALLEASLCVWLVLLCPRANTQDFANPVDLEGPTKVVDEAMEAIRKTRGFSETALSAYKKKIEDVEKLVDTAKSKTATATPGEQLAFAERVWDAQEELIVELEKDLEHSSSRLGEVADEIQGIVEGHAEQSEFLKAATQVEEGRKRSLSTIRDLQRKLATDQKAFEAANRESPNYRSYRKAYKTTRLDLATQIEGFAYVKKQADYCKLVIETLGKSKELLKAYQDRADEAQETFALLTVQLGGKHKLIKLYRQGNKLFQAFDELMKLAQQGEEVQKVVAALLALDVTPHIPELPTGDGKGKAGGGDPQATQRSDDDLINWQPK